MHDVFLWIDFVECLIDRLLLLINQYMFMIGRLIDWSTDQNMIID